MSIKYALYKNFLSFTRCKKLKVGQMTSSRDLMNILKVWWLIMMIGHGINFT